MKMGMENNINNKTIYESHIRFTSCHFRHTENHLRHTPEINGLSIGCDGADRDGDDCIRPMPPTNVHIGGVW